jgi:hypothetical protein
LNQLADFHKIITLDDQEFERPREFKYLGSTVIEDSGITIEIKQGIVMANCASYGLEKQLSSFYLF